MQGNLVYLCAERTFYSTDLQMLRHAITDYIDAFENPDGIFRTLGDVAVERDVYGAPLFRAGNSAAIFTYRDGGRQRFLKCYIRPNPHLRTVYDYIERRRPTLLPRVRLLREEIFVHTHGGDAGWVDVVDGEWTEGETLAAAVARAAKRGDVVRLGALADAFDELCASLSAAEWAHGDLKPENIVVRSGNVAERSGSALPSVQPLINLPTLTLIDCDAMWIPALAGERAAELGTPGYRHPSRTAAHFDKTIDDYPAQLLSVSLRAIATAPELYAKYNSPEVLLLSPLEIATGRSAAFEEVLELFGERGMERELRKAAELAAE
jgi:serine/threonine protein kinase